MRIRLTLILVSMLIVFAFGAPVPGQGSAPQVLFMEMDGPVTAVMAEYLERGIQTAEARGVEALIFQLNTPGGSVDIMQDMVEAIRASQVPVVVYVAPRGAIAGSAGTVITLAGHVAAMAPETAIGAASPVGGQGEDLGETIESKLKESMKATVRSLSERRPPGAVALAEKTIEDAVAASASEALEVGMVDFIATDLDDLLEQMDEFQVETASGEQTLQTTGAQVTELPLTLIEQLLSVLTNPNIVFILLTVGVQAILIELGSPGGWVPGFIGVVALALAGYGLGFLPVNWFGLIFLVTSFVLFILDIKAPTHGALTIAGTASFIVGALVLFNSPNTPSFQRVSVPLVIGGAAMTAGSFALVLTFALRAQRVPVRTGRESLVGRVGVARSDIAPRGTVHVAGEEWSAQGAPEEGDIPQGSRVEVVSVQGVRLLVRPARQAQEENL
jgi:membrane-bound serine protease (ClpP class)